MINCMFLFLCDILRCRFALGRLVWLQLWCAFVFKKKPILLIRVAYGMTQSQEALPIDLNINVATELEETFSQSCSLVYLSTV